MGTISRLAKGFFDRNRKRQPKRQKDGRWPATMCEYFGNNVDADDSGNRYEDEAIQHLPHRWLASPERINERPEQQGKDAEKKSHRDVALLCLL